MDRGESTRDVIVTPLLAAPKPWSIDAFGPFGRNLVNTIMQEHGSSSSRLQLQDPAHIYGSRPTASPTLQQQQSDSNRIASYSESVGIVQETPLQEIHSRRECDASSINNDGLKFKKQPFNENVLSEQIIEDTPLEEMHLRKECKSTGIRDDRSRKPTLIQNCKDVKFSEKIIDDIPLEEMHLRKERKALGIRGDGFMNPTCNEVKLSQQIIENTPFEEIYLRRESKALNVCKPKISKRPKVIQGRAFVISPKQKMKGNKPKTKMRQTKLTEILEVHHPTSRRAEQDWCLSDGFVETVFGAAKRITEVPKFHQRKLTDILVRDGPKRNGISGNCLEEELAKRKWESSGGGGGGGAGHAKKAKYPDDRKSHRTGDSFDPSTRYKE